MTTDPQHPTGPRAHAVGGQGMHGSGTGGAHAVGSEGMQAPPTAGPDTNRRYEHATDAIPPAEPLHGARGTYEKGELGSIGEIVGEITQDVSTLMRQEVALAKAELTDSATKAGKGAGMLAGAGVAAHFMLFFLSFALWWALGDAMDSMVWSAIIVGLIWGVIAAILAVVGKGQLKNIKGMPRTVDTAKRVPDALKGNEEYNR